MSNDPIAGLDRDNLEKLTRSLLWQYRVVDAFWFINVENRYDLTTAEDLNAAVWAKVGKLAARDIKERFGITATGLRGVVQAMHYYPWYLMDAFRIEDRGTELIVTSDNCPAQLGRFKHGLGEYACKEMHAQEFIHFCAVIDPKIRVECEFAPPDPHPEGQFCKWRISCG